MSLFVVATPIGNLEDMTLRAIRVLGEASLVVAEDTRQTKKLLTKYEIKTPLVTIHQHSDKARVQQVIDRLLGGENVALVTDAGTPNIADPGGVLVAAAREAGVAVVPIPGASAITTILSVAGIPSDSFMFVGFLPKKKGRQTLWQDMSEVSVPLVIFESPARVVKTLTEAKQHLGERKIVVGRELTKLHEEIFTGTITAAINHFTKLTPKGEFVIVIAPEYN